VLGGGVRSASVAFGPAGQVLLVTFQTGALVQFDAAGPHLLGPGVLYACVAFAPFGEVVDLIFEDGSVWQFDALGAHRLGTVG
jgi:hypothetical protein